MEEFNEPRGTLPHEGAQARSLRRTRKFLDKLSHLLGQPSSKIRLLDVGCSSGAFLGAAVNLGYRAEGVEPAARAAATAQSAGLTVRQGLLHEAAYDDGQFDAVTLLEVIEHLNEPLALLQECHRILRPGGILLIGTANAASWSAKAFGAHWDYLSIAKLAAKAQFSVAALTTRSVRFCDRDNSAEPVYTLLKIVAELVNPLASWINKGSDMAMYLRRT
jgi:2-polyprenyl-3-methyl-5-hydroxy-6-metoxy-1,4-benzoquinol methylase